VAVELTLPYWSSAATVKATPAFPDTVCDVLGGFWNTSFTGTPPVRV
jgi:hypothetical protein